MMIFYSINIYYFFNKYTNKSSHLDISHNIALKVLRSLILIDSNQHILMRNVVYLRPQMFVLMRFKHLIRSRIRKDPI